MMTVFLKKTVLVAASALALSSVAVARQSLPGSDTLAGAITDAIIAAGLDSEITYIGGGSGNGEKALKNGEIGITAMSRPLKAEVLAEMQTQNVQATQHVIALDGVGIFVNSVNPVPSFDLATLVKIFSCQYTSWSQVPNSGRSGPIVGFRRDDVSGTTDTFKALTGLTAFGECITVVADTIDIAEHTANNPDAIGYAGLSAKKAGNRTAAIAKNGGTPVLPLAQTIRDHSYPLSRELFLVEVTGARAPNEVESKLMEFVLDRSFMDPIVQDHDFITID